MLDRIRISSRINGGFGVVVALLLGLAALTWTASSGLGGLFSTYQNEVRLVERANDLRNAMRLTQFAVADFRADPGEPSAAQLDQALGGLGARAAALRDLANRDTEVAAVAEIEQAVARFTALANGYREVTETTVARTSELTQLGIEHRRGIGALRSALEERGAMDLAYDALRASDAFLVTRVRIDRFFAGWPAEEFDTATAPFEQTAAALDRVSRGGLMPEERAILSGARSGIASFLETAMAARDAELARRPASMELDAAATALVTRVEAMMAKVIEGQAALEAAGDTRVATTQTTTVAVSVAALVLAMLIAWVIGRSVAGSAGGMARSISRIADGDLETPVGGTDHKTEIGVMARSLEVLRENARAAEKERAARAESEERRAEFFDQLGRNLADLASGGLATRMQRADHPGVDEVTLRLCDDFNALGQSFSTLIAQAQSSATSVRETAAQLAQGSGEMSHRAETQAATLEQSAAALDEMTASVKSAADKASEADGAVGTVRREADDSRAVVAATVAAMG
ncbi:HAMP domain-containing protein, partial [Rhodobaculum claviforme]|nr:hypothetical protein [Rhodobaculum claviforme]